MINLSYSSAINKGSFIVNLTITITFATLNKHVLHIRVVDFISTQGDYPFFQSVPKFIRNEKL